MKKLFTLLFAVALVTAASAQSGDRHRNDSRSTNNSYQSAPYSNNDQKGYSSQYQNADQYNRNSQWNDNKNSQWNDRGDQNRFDQDRKQAERERNEMMMRRNQPQYRDERRYENRSSGVALPLLGIGIGIVLSAILSHR